MARWTVWGLRSRRRNKSSYDDNHLYQLASHSHSGFLLSEKSKKLLLQCLILPATIRALSGSYNFVMSVFISDAWHNSDEPTSKSTRKTATQTSKGKTKQEPVSEQEPISDSGSEIEVYAESRITNLSTPDSNQTIARKR